MFWFTLVIGIVILSAQVYRYVTGTLQLSVGEFGVTVLAVVLMANPHFISNSYRRIINSKFNESNDA